MRVLVVDPSRLLPWIVRHELGEDAEIVAVRTFEDAERAVRERPPDAAVVSLPPAHLPWQKFQHLCATRVPPVPVLYESCVPPEKADFTLDPGDGYAAFLLKPACRRELRAALESLLAAAGLLVPASD